ncbi:MAG: hypothetical protein ACI87E_003179, partial [Mariniblastus sp.]
MNPILLKKCSQLAVAVLVFAFARPALAEEPLKIFILAGQSNMVGHARAHTIATLYQSDDLRDKELIQLVFDKSSGISQKIFKEQLVRGRKIDELTGGISNEKIKSMSAGPEKTALSAKVKKLVDAHEAYKAKVASSCIVSDRVYINSIADGNKKSGKLSVGCGGDDKKIGPEYAFGLSMA